MYSQRFSVSNQHDLLPQLQNIKCTFIYLHTHTHTYTKLCTPKTDDANSLEEMEEFIQITKCERGKTLKLYGKNIIHLWIKVKNIDLAIF